MLRVFAVPFLAVGVGFLLVGVLGTLAERAWMSTWVPVPAQVLEAGLHRSDTSAKRRTPTFRVTVVYRYEAPDGSGPRLGTRAALHTGADSLEDRHRDLWGRLEAARVNGTPWTVWVDPDDPDRSVADRALSAGVLLLHLGVGVIFGGVGAVAWWGGGALHRAARPGADGTRRAHPAHALGTSAVMLGVFAGFWIVFSLLVTAFALPQAWNGRPAAALVLLFPAAGVVLAVAARAAWRLWRAWRDVALELPDGPGRPGQGWRVAVTLPAWQRGQRARWELRRPGADAAARCRAVAEALPAARAGQPGAHRLLARLELPEDLLDAFAGRRGRADAAWLLCLVLERHGPAEVLSFPLEADPMGRLVPAHPPRPPAR